MNFETTYYKCRNTQQTQTKEISLFVLVVLARDTPNIYQKRISEIRGHRGIPNGSE